MLMRTARMREQPSGRLEFYPIRNTGSSSSETGCNQLRCMVLTQPLKRFNFSELYVLLNEIKMYSMLVYPFIILRNSN